MLNIYFLIDFPANSIRDYLLPAIQNLLKDVEALNPAHKEALEIIMKERSGGTFYSINKVMAGAHLAFPASVNNIFGEGGLLGKKDTTTDRSSEAASSPNTGAPSPAEDTRFRRIMLGNSGDMLHGKGKKPKRMVKNNKMHVLHRDSHTSGEEKSHLSQVQNSETYIQNSKAHFENPEESSSVVPPSSSTPFLSRAAFLLHAGNTHWYIHWPILPRHTHWMSCKVQKLYAICVNMEASLLANNSFTKSTEQLIPTIRAGSLAFSKQSSQQLRCRKVRVPYHISCCQSSSSPLDDDKPTLSGDWRAFRAKLVAGGVQLLRADEASSMADPDTVVDQPPLITIGDKWAHKIHEPEKGCLLIATEKLDGVHIFERTVILLLSTGPLGPSGIILNRPSLMSIKETRSTALDVEGTFSNSPLFFGGPLEEGLFLVSPKEGNSDESDDGVGKSGVFEEVMKGLYYGGKESVGCAAEMVKRNVVGLGDFRFFDGYCGWDKEQLKDEIRAGYWTVAACSPSVVGLASVGSIGLWNEVLGLMGKRKVK
ncbi:hypothetical protein S83_013665 [Arachis hypogaea]